MTKKSFLILLVLSLVLAACGGSADEETVEEPAVVEEAETLDSPAVTCLLYTSPSPRDQRGSRMPSSA